MILFETDRLFARRLTVNDVDAMVAIYGDVETVRYVGDSEPIGAKECLHWIDVTDRNFERRGYGMIAFCDKASGEVVGCGGIVHPDQQEEPEIKYAFLKSHWGKGYATEAVGGLLQFGRETLKLGEIMATVFPENSASQHVLTKLGFVKSDDLVEDDGSITQVWKLAVSS